MIEFVHIQKCGGSSVHRYFVDIFSHEETTDITYFSTPESTLSSNIKMILGHRRVDFFYKFFSFNSDKPDRFSIIREPAERLWSYYHYILSKPTLPEYVDVSQQTFSEFCRYCANSTGHTISQSEYITGQKKASQERIINALKVNFNRVGVLENLQQELAIISRDNKLPIMPVFHRNAAKDRDDHKAEGTPSKKETLLIEELFPEDYFLYAAVRSIF